MYFEKLPKNYQDAIDKAITGKIGHDTSDSARAFREWEAEALLGCDISEADTVCGTGHGEFEDDLCAFRAGWNEGRKRQPAML